MKGVKIIVKGKVQGVFFRASALNEARRLSIFGTVENTKLGDVKIIAEGSDENLEKFLVWCRKGPLMAAVTSMTINDVEVFGYKEFSILNC